MSLGFRVGKFRDGGLLNIVYGFIFPNFLTFSKINNLNLRFRVGKFPDSGLLNIPLVLFSQGLNYSKESDLHLGFRIKKIRHSNLPKKFFMILFCQNFN